MLHKEKTLAKQSKEILEIKNRLLKINGELKQGDFVIGDRGDIYKIGKFSMDKNYKEGYQQKIELLNKDSDGKWSHYGDCEMSEFENGKYVKIDIEKEEDYENYEEKMLQEAIKPTKKEEDTIEESNERALVMLNKDFLVSQKKSVENTQRKYQILERILENKRYELKSYVMPWSTGNISR